MAWFDEHVAEISSPVLHTPPGDANAWGAVHQLGYEEVRISPDEEAGALVFSAHYMLRGGEFGVTVAAGKPRAFVRSRGLHWGIRCLQSTTWSRRQQWHSA
jgi:hypothetical protein